jgi:hypothetical protein
MSAYLNQIFYKTNKFDTPDKLVSLIPYMLSHDLIKKIKKLSADNKDQEPIIPNKENSKVSDSEGDINVNKNIFFPQRENSLFWCIYISHYGINEFLYNKKLQTTIEIEEKHKIIEYLKKQPKDLKNSNHKITNIMIQEIYSDIMSLSTPTLLSVFGFSLFYKKNIYIVNNRTYYSFFYNKDIDSSEESAVIINYNNESGLFGLDQVNIMENITRIKNNLVCLEGIDKPLRGMSAYKVEELEDYARKLNIKSEVHLKKKELYDIIHDTCLWNENIFTEKKRK